MYVSAPTMFGGVTLPPVQTKSFMNCAVSGWLDSMKLIAESRIFSCVVKSGGLGVGVGLAEPVGVCVVVGVGVGLGVMGNGAADVGVTVGSGEGVGVGEAFWERSCGVT
jgi:hypothetical protein